MTKSVSASEVSGTVVAPASKSVAQRAIVAALLANGTSTLHNLTLCNDTEAALGVARLLGADIQENGYSYRITAKGVASLPNEERTLFCGESGLLTRMIMPVVSLLCSKTTITGHGSILERPVDMIAQPLRDLGASITTNNGSLPAVIEGAIKGGATNIDGSISSQMLTGLLLALPLASQDSTLYVRNLKSKPYIGITIDLLKSFGIAIENEGYEVFRIKGNQQYKATDYNVEGDWSGASCLLVAGCIAGNVTVNSLDINSPQADKAILDALRLANANVCIGHSKPFGSVTTTYSSSLQSFEFDATECPDLFPALVALAASCNGTSKIYGAKRLTHKESNRALTLQQEFGKLGIKIAVQDDLMLVTGGTVTGGEASSHNDHRIAMALATAALKATGKVTISQAESVSKSYPQFWDDLQHSVAQCGNALKHGLFPCGKCLDRYIAFNYRVQDRCRIGSDGEKGRVPHVEHPGVAEDDVQGQREDGVDADLVQDAQPVRPQPQGREGGEDEDAEEGEDFLRARTHALFSHSFSATRSRRRPVGRMTRMRIRTAKVMASRHASEM